MRLRFHISAVVLLAMVAAGRGATPETLETLVQKSDLLVVAQVTDIQNLRQERSERWGAVVIKRATLRVIRGIHPETGSPVTLEEIAVEYPATPPNGEIRINGPEFPNLSQDQVALFPLKYSADKSRLQFISEEDRAMIIPAARRPLAAKPATPRDFLLHELASAFANGDYQNKQQAGVFLGALGAEPPSGNRPAATPVADALFTLIRGEIGETNLREDQRWLQIGIASYTAAQGPRPTLNNLLNEKSPAEAPFQLARLCLGKCSTRDLDQRIIQLLISHQEDPGAPQSTFLTLAKNYADHPLMLTLERLAIADGKPGAMAVAYQMIDGAKHPLAATAVKAARELFDYQADPSPHELPDQTIFHAEALLVHFGTDDDFAFFLDQVRRARTRDPNAYRMVLLTASNLQYPDSRLLEIARQYLDDTTPVFPKAAEPSDRLPTRLCDRAVDLIERVTHQNFGGNPADRAPSPDAAVEKARAYLKSKQ